MKFFVALQSEQGFMNDLRRERKTCNPQAITCPTLIIHSRFDGSVSLEHAKHNARDIPAAELLIIDVEIYLGWLSDTWNTALIHKRASVRYLIGFVNSAGNSRFSLTASIPRTTPPPQRSLSARPP